MEFVSILDKTPRQGLFIWKVISSVILEQLQLDINAASETNYDRLL